MNSEQPSVVGRLIIGYLRKAAVLLSVAGLFLVSVGVGRAFPGAGSAYAATTALNIVSGGVASGGITSGGIKGQVRLMNRRGTSPARAVSTSDVLVFYTPNEPYDKPPSAKGRPGEAPRYEMATVKKTYAPRVLPVPKGTKVSFPNQDRVLHNVFSVSGANRFDLDLYGPGKSRSHTFEEPGLVRVFCNVHRDMVGFVWVLETPFFVRPDSAGRFTLDGLPKGSGTLSVWHERARTAAYEVGIGEGVVVQDVELKITRPRLASHARKDGSSYRRRRGY